MPASKTKVDKKSSNQKVVENAKNSVELNEDKKSSAESKNWLKWFFKKKSVKNKENKDVVKTSKEKKKRGWMFKLFKALLILVLILIILVGAGAVAGYYYLKPYYDKVQSTLPQVQQQVDNLKIAAKNQNLTDMKTGLDSLRTSLLTFDSILDDFYWLNRLPRVDIYWQDGKHLLAGGGYLVDAAQAGVDALVPYADLIGFSVEAGDQMQTKISAGVQQWNEEDAKSSLPALLLLKTPINSDIKAKLESFNLKITGENGKFVNIDLSRDSLDSLKSLDEVLYIYLDSESKQVLNKFGNLGVGGAQTAEDRIQFVVDTLDKLGPQLDTISDQIANAEKEFSQVDPERYPSEIKGLKVRSMLLQVIDMTAQAKVLITDARPVLEVAPYILGNDEPRKYLVLLQNDAELRPTGGFLTAYSLLTVNKGKVTPGFSRDIYDLDAKYHSSIPAPDPLVKYISDPYAKEKAAGKIPKLRIRDSNLSPDFKNSMDLFYEEYLKTGSTPVDGIIAVNTKFLLGLLNVLGPIGVGGIGNFSSEVVPECNCPQVIYKLESAISYETPYLRANRKAIIGPLMHSVLENAMGTPKEKMSDLVQAGLDAIQQKHLMVYFTDEKVQSAIESFNMGGRVVDADNDYLMVVDTNFGGAKSNLYIQEDAELKIQADSENAVHELTLTFKNPQANDEWLNGEYFDWIRIYVPKGSKLIEDVGSETPMQTSEDLGKTVFSGFFSLRPEGLSKLTVKYETPVNQYSPYKLLIQKQGGTNNWYYNVNVNDQVQEIELNGDKYLTFSL